MSRGGADPKRFNVPSLSQPTLIKQYLEVLQTRRPLRERQMTSVGCNEICSLDWCNHTYGADAIGREEAAAERGRHRAAQRARRDHDGTRSGQQ